MRSIEESGQGLLRIAPQYGVLKIAAMMLVADIAISPILGIGFDSRKSTKNKFFELITFQPYGNTVKPHFMTNTKNTVSKKNNTRNAQVNNAKNTLKGAAHSWNSVAKAFQMSQATAQGRECFQAFNTLGMHMRSLACLKASDFFTAWWGGLKDEQGFPQLWKSVGFTIDLNGKDYTLYTLKESGDYSRVSVYEKKSIISETDKNFNKKKHAAPTTDVVVEGLSQCALCDTWRAKVAKATAKAESLKEGYINCGTSQKPEWRKVVLTTSGWSDVTTCDGKLKK